MSEGMNQVSEWLKPAGISAIGTLVFAFVAFFKDTILKKWNRPKFELELNDFPPDSSILISAGGYPVCHFRVRILNSGNTAAEKVELYAKELKKINDDKEEIVSEFLPMNLTWSHLEAEKNIYMKTIPPKTYKHCDIGYVTSLPFSKNSPDWRSVVKSNSLFKENMSINKDSKFFVLSKPIVATNFESWLPKGNYTLTLVVAASNANPKEFRIDIKHNDVWKDEIEEFIKEGTSLQLK